MALKVGVVFRVIAQGWGDPTEEDYVLVKDRVCGMEIETEKAAAHMEFEGKIYRFCSLSCRDKFYTSPQAYTKKQPSDHTRGGHEGCC